MKKLSSLLELNRFLSQISPKKSLGFVPTMGALHKGHASLVKRSVDENDCSICSIFINPTQFNNRKDLVSYPQTITEDLELLQNLNCDAVFTPTVKEIYPTSTFVVSHPLDVCHKNLEGKSRPGHFEGVVAVVSRLFDLIQPNKAYFGEKDRQQLSIIKSLAKKSYKHINIVSCPTLRASDGLALSSRNVRLDDQGRLLAPKIFENLLVAKNMAKYSSLKDVRTWVHKEFQKTGGLNLDYFEFVDPNTFKTSCSWDSSDSHIACIAVNIGPVRLIDNILIDF